MKKIVRSLMIISVVMLMLVITSSVDSYGATKKAKKEVTYTLKKGVLTIKGKGKMPKTMNFKNNKKVKKVVIKKGVTSISYKAFYKCKKLKTVKISNTVKRVGALSFYDTGIKKIMIPKSVKIIGNEAIAGCDNLTEITLPGDFKVKSTLSCSTSNIMLWCKKLKTVNFNTNFNIIVAQYCAGKEWNVRKNDPNYKSINGIIYTKDGKELVRVPGDVKILKVAQGCETFCFEAIFYEIEFYDAGDPYVNCDKLKKIVMPKTIKYIDNNKHAYISAVDYPIQMELNEVVIKNTNMDSDNIEKLISCLKRIYKWGIFNEKYTFDDIEEIAEMMPERIIKEGDFYILDKTILLNYQGNDKSVTIPKGIKRIGDKAFARKKCKKIILPEGIEEIGEGAFSECNKLEEINLPDGIKEIESYAFEYTKLKKVIIPSSVEKLGERIF